MSKGERVLSMHECEEVGVCASKCMSKRTKPDWVHTSLELCKRKNKKKCVFRCTESASVHHRKLQNMQREERRKVTTTRTGLNNDRCVVSAICKFLFYFLHIC